MCSGRDLLAQILHIIIIRQVRIYECSPSLEDKICFSLKVENCIPATANTIYLIWKSFTTIKLRTLSRYCFVVVVKSHESACWFQSSFTFSLEVLNSCLKLINDSKACALFPVLKTIII